MPHEHKIIVENLFAGFGKKQVIHDVNIQFKDKSITAILGPSGCGKSTLVRCLNRMHEVAPASHVFGRVLLEGSDIYAPTADVVQVRRRVGMVFQKPTPFPTMTIFQNVAAGLRISGEKNPDILNERIRDSLEKASLWEEVKNDLNKPGTCLSGGQQQRLCIARALAVQPEVLLLDEPCSALDPRATERIEKLLHNLKKTKTIIMVTHNLAQARRVSEHTAYLLDGKLIEHGPTRQVFENPQETLTREYIEGRFG